MKKVLNIKNATHKELLIEYEECEKIWGMYSCDCFGYYIQELHSEITKRGGWPLSK